MENIDLTEFEKFKITEVEGISSNFFHLVPFVHEIGMNGFSRFCKKNIALFIIHVLFTILWKYTVLLQKLLLILMVLINVKCHTV